MNEREILTDSINAHQKAIDEAKCKLNDLEVTYSIGDRFKCGDDKCILALAQGSQHNPLVIMVTLVNGIRHNDPKTVYDINKITSSELSEICNCTPTRYWDNRKKVRI